MNLKIKIQKNIEVPDGTKVITNNNFLTLAVPLQGRVYVYTKVISDLDILELKDISNYTEFTKEELKKMLKLL